MLPSTILQDFQRAIHHVAQDELVLERASTANPWFTPGLIQTALEALDQWFLEPLPDLEPVKDPLRVGIIMAGNLPLVGLHDLVMTRLAGHYAVVKPSSRDQVLVEAVIHALSEANRAQIEVVPSLPWDIDALVAMGSDNTARYLAHDFQNVPRLVRQHRYSVGIWTGEEDREMAQGMARDILLYHGMGCRSVSNLLVRAGSDMGLLQEALTAFPKEWMTEGWDRQVEWEGAIRGMGGTLPERYGLVWERNEQLVSVPVGVLNIVEVDSEEKKQELLAGEENRIQCVVGMEEAILPGQAQCPGLWDFADQVDTYRWLKQF